MRHFVKGFGIDGKSAIGEDMKIKELEIKNFGKFSNQRFVFEDGIQIFYGENEFGKSTILRIYKSDVVWNGAEVVEKQRTMMHSVALSPGKIPMNMRE